MSAKDMSWCSERTRELLEFALWRDPSFVEEMITKPELLKTSQDCVVRKHQGILERNP